MEYGQRVPKRVAVWPNGDMGEHSFRVHVATDPHNPVPLASWEDVQTAEEDKLGHLSPSSSRSSSPIALLNRTLSAPSSGTKICFTSILLTSIFWVSLLLGTIMLIFRSVIYSNVEYFYYSMNAPLDGRPNKWSPRVAICLAGGLRHFELTGTSIKENLLLAYPNTDVYIVTPKDENSWKLHLLEESNVVGVKVVNQKDYVLTDEIKFVIHESASPNGRQGLLKYLGLVEGCKELIEEYEGNRGFKYEWIVRTRPDAVWSNRPPALRRLKRRDFYIPQGSDWWGLNDRFTLGNREDSLASFAGISAIPTHYKLNHSWLTSEEKFQKLLEFNGIQPRIRRDVLVPFCVLTKRVFSFPPLDLSSAPVAPLGSVSAQNGAYCWPCLAETRPALIRQVPRTLFGNQKEFCNTGNNWPPYWRELFDSSVSPKVSKSRTFFEENQSYRYCVFKTYSFFRNISIQRGGFSPKELCRLAFPNPNFLDWMTT